MDILESAKFLKFFNLKKFDNLFNFDKNSG